MTTVRSSVATWVVALGLSAGVLVVACGKGTPDPKSAKVTEGGSKDPSKWPSDDRSMCDWKNKADLEVSETAGPGAIKPNVRRVFKTVGDADNRHKTLVCREIDTNLDGIKDVMRTFNAKGEALHEQSDTDYDGKVDIWMNFVNGRLEEEDNDTNKDGKPDVWKFYVDGALNRVKRDRNFDGQPDVWEIYNRGHLERMGVDDTFDGHVDRWDRDEQLKYEAEAADRKARDEMMNAESAARGDAGGGGSGTSPSGGDAGAGAKDAGAAKAITLPKAAVTPPKKK